MTELHVIQLIIACEYAFLVGYTWDAISAAGERMGWAVGRHLLAVERHRDRLAELQVRVLVMGLGTHHALLVSAQLEQIAEGRCPHGRLITHCHGEGRCNGVTR